MRFTVAIYHEDTNDHEQDTEERFPCGENLFVSVLFLGAVTVVARSEREAAAKAWIDLIGVKRADILRELNAPSFIIAHQTTVEAIVQDLRDSGLGGMSCELYNGVESWFFQVDCVDNALFAERIWWADIPRQQCGHAAGSVPFFKLLSGLFTRPVAGQGDAPYPQGDHLWN